MDVKRRVRIDKDYCSSTVWSGGCNWEESDFSFNEEQLALAKAYDVLWEDAHQDLYKVDVEMFNLAEVAKFKLLKSLYHTHPDIEWTYWDHTKDAELQYLGILPLGLN